MLTSKPECSRTQGFVFLFKFIWLRESSLVAWSVKSLPAAQETQIRSRSREEDSLEKEMATHSSILAWEFPWTEEPGGPQSMESQSWTGLGD